jgi:hypothetical protein
MKKQLSHNETFQETFKISPWQGIDYFIALL